MQSKEKMHFHDFSAKILSATEIWNRENSLVSISSFSQSLDAVLGDSGLRLGTLTEVLGLPGSGKTQFCLQLCTSIQIPKSLGGHNAEALYIDTSTNFTACRFREILTSALLRCQQLLNLPLHYDIEKAMQKLHFVNTKNLDQFTAFMERLPTFIQARPNIRLIVIDSMTFPFKEGISAKRRTGLLYRLMAELQKTVVEHQLGVVLTNEMSTRVGVGVVGAMGDAWAHRCATRVLLARDGRHWKAALLKGSHAAAAARFQITGEGVRDID